MPPNDTSKAAELRKAERTRKRDAADKRAAMRARLREGINGSEPSVEMDLLMSVLQYAEDRMMEAAWSNHDPRAASVSPMAVDVVEVAMIREMVRRYAHALSSAWLSSLELPPALDPIPCEQCGAPRLEVKLVVSDKP